MLANRPVSPHLQVYRLPLTGLISITHRITGVMLSLGFALFVSILLGIALGASVYQQMQAFLRLWPCQLVYWAFIYALFFHLCHGVRHLIWDIGKGFERNTLILFAISEIIGSLVLTGTIFFLFDRGIL